MDRDAYRPDPPTGLGWSDYLTARDRYLASLAAGSEIARLERAFALNPDDERAARAATARPSNPGASARAGSSPTS